MRFGEDSLTQSYRASYRVSRWQIGGYTLDVGLSCRQIVINSKHLYCEGSLGSIAKRLSVPLWVVDLRCYKT